VAGENMGRMPVPRKPGRRWGMQGKSGSQGEFLRFLRPLCEFKNSGGVWLSRFKFLHGKQMKVLAFSWRKLGGKERGERERGVGGGESWSTSRGFPIPSVLRSPCVFWANSDLEESWSTRGCFSNCAELVSGFRIFRIVKERVRPGDCWSRPGGAAVHSFVYQEGERNSSRLFRPVVEY
jgi:hypothetical protein